jgi:hypothetical protein
MVKATAKTIVEAKEKTKVKVTDEVTTPVKAAISDPITIPCTTEEKVRIETEKTAKAMVTIPKPANKPLRVVMIQKIANVISTTIIS